MSSSEQLRHRKRVMFNHQRRKCWVCREEMPCPDLTREAAKAGEPKSPLDPVDAVVPAPKGWSAKYPFMRMLHRQCRDELGYPAPRTNQDRRKKVITR